MGKKGRKTRWRTLTITDEHSDSEESNTTTSGHRLPKGYPQKSYYSRFTYSSQSTPTRRYQCDGTKSTRSSSTASENKITFNEDQFNPDEIKANVFLGNSTRFNASLQFQNNDIDEYTRITTPRQDVLFKKGYLNKPKIYQTQTSTGNSTTSTGNSTGNGTPDHQSTDLEYESQFVFPNGFVDQNGIYYVNSFEPYPLMVFNPPTYYPEFTNVKSKRCSTDSLTESTSPNNEETSQDLSQGETSNVSDFNHVYNVIYPGFYYNGACQSQDAAHQPEPRRTKKKRRRKPSRSKPAEDATTSEYTDEEESSDDVSVEQSEENRDGECEEAKEKNEEEAGSKQKYNLKPDAEEFVPRAYRDPESIPLEPNVQFIKIPPNFVPLSVINPMGDFSCHNFNAFIPPGIPINFIPQNYVNFIPSGFLNKMENVQVPKQTSENVEEKIKETVEVPKNQIDIAKIVSKLEEAAKEQDNESIKEETNEDIKQEISKSVVVKTIDCERNKKSRPQKGTVDENKTNEKKDEKKHTTWKPTNSPKKESSQITITSKPITRNYSDTLKKPQVIQPQCDRYEKHMEKQKLNNKLNYKEAVVQNQTKVEAIPKTTNQWISVSNRKKRKNKNMEETEDFEEIEEVDKEKVSIEDNNVKNTVEMLPLPEPKPPSPLPNTEEIEVVKNEGPIPVVKTTEEVIEKKKDVAPKKKSKKNQKLITKRVIVKDVDLSQEVEKKTETIETKVETVPEDKKVDNSVEEEQKVEVSIKEEVIVEKQDPVEKKMKKKKKKPVKPPILGESNSTTTLNVIDDSYDFLLETSLLNESQEKTNVEVSQELDKMIQRGMYSNLEEKIKSLNIDSNDNFFKTIIHNISSREESVEKTNYDKNPDFAKLLNSTTQLLKPKPVIVDAPKLGAFLGESTPKRGGDPSPNDNLYPITKAVKEWMTKTRETTPDVEILKSPSAIFREFGDAKDPKNDSLVESVGDNQSDEVTVYSFSREGSEHVLGCWEDESDPQEVVQLEETASSLLEEDGEVIEAYESAYGRNEDYLRIKREVEEKRVNGGFPKHGNLPYRAICCSIM